MSKYLLTFLLLLLFSTSFFALADIPIGKAKESVKILDKISHNITDQALFVNLGNGYNAMKRYDLAAKAYFQAINIIPNRMLPRYLIVKMYLSKHDTLKAKLMAKKIITMPVKVPSVEASKMINEMTELLESL